MKAVRALTLTTVLLFPCTAAFAVTIPTVPVGNPGNPADTRYLDANHPNGVGAISYPFQIGKTEITNSQYVEFLNAVAATDTYELFHRLLIDDQWNGIVRTGASGSFHYAVKAATVIPFGPLAGTTYSYDEKPTVLVSWDDAARFANWLHNGQPSGPQNAATTEDGAYSLNGATSDDELAAVTRNPGARWWLPNEDEWYKAAFHQNDGVTGNYWNYATGSDSLPDNNMPSSETGNSANYSLLNPRRLTTGDNWFPMTDAGAYSQSDSPYGTFDQAGNVAEWNETLFQNGARGIRGSSWQAFSFTLSAAVGEVWSPEAEFTNLGFRLATVIPEPSGMTLFGLGIIGALIRRGRR